MTRTILLAGVLATLLVTPGAVVGHGPVPRLAAPAQHVADFAPAQHAADFAPAQHVADFAPALAADGTFQGAAGVAGAVDTAAWTLVSDLAAGEPPRFAPASATRVVSQVDAGSWSALGSKAGDGALNGSVWAIVASGTDLYVGGAFTDAAGLAAADYVAKWNGSVWSALGSNGDGSGVLNGDVRALAISGSDLYAAGLFYDAAGIPKADCIAKWNGSTWSPLGSNGADDGALNDGAIALAVLGADLYVGGGFTNVAGIPAADYVAKWDGNTWSALDSPGAANGALNDTVRALTIFGGDLYAGGFFTNAAGNPEADYIAGWDGSAWFALGSNGPGVGALDYGVYALAASDAALYAGGGFANAAGDAEADYVAMWNGAAWSALGSDGSGDGALGDVVRALTVSGGAVYVGGWFTNAAGNPAADYLGRWNGSAWSALGVNGSGNGALTGYIYALGLSGGALVAGGASTNAGGIPAADYVAKWSPGSAVVRKPDGRIRLGTSGAYAGNNVYNTSGTGQTKTGSAKKGRTITFGISVQNDGTAADSFKLKATGAAASAYTVKYYAGTKDITAKVVAGTYRTASLAKGAATLITVKVTIKTSATAGSRVTRLVTITSVASSSKKDAVKVVAKRS